MALALQRVSLYCGGVGGPSVEVSSSPEATSSSQDEETSTSSSCASGVKRKHQEIEEDDDDDGTESKKGHFRPWTPPPTPSDEPIPLVISRSSSSETVRTSSKSLTPTSSANLSPSLPPPPPPKPVNNSRSGAFRGQRNYKNMTRERRMEANARERSRVHTISAAFDKLRKAVPAYSHKQKLSKLSVLRVAASYIMTLSRVLGNDYSADQSAPSLQECVDNVSNTIQMEGKLRKRKDD